jgi:hypothetical protein
MVQIRRLSSKCWVTSSAWCVNHLQVHFSDPQSLPPLRRSRAAMPDSIIVPRPFSNISGKLPIFEGKNSNLSDFPSAFPHISVARNILLDGHPGHPGHPHTAARVSLQPSPPPPGSPQETRTPSERTAAKAREEPFRQRMSCESQEDFRGISGWNQWSLRMDIIMYIYIYIIYILH